MEKAVLLERQCPAVEARTHGESLSTRGCALGSLNTPVLDSTDDRVVVIPKENCPGASARSRVRA